MAGTLTVETPTALTIRVVDIKAALTAFDAIKIKRSVDGVSGSYVDLTASTPKAATLAPPASGPYNVSSRTLQLLRDSEPQVNIVFSGVDPLSADQVATQINAAVGVSVAAEVGGELVLTSTLTGTGSKLEIAGGDAASAFGWSAGDRDVGEAAHIQLVQDQSIYKLVDHDADPNYFYKAYLLNTENGLVGPESAPFQAEEGVLAASEDLSLATVDLVDGRGVALQGQEISLYNIDEAFSVDGTYRIALTRSPITIVTDSVGHAEVSLVRGSKWKAVFEGTSLVREFTVPDLVTFDLLLIVATSPDPFKIKEPQFPAAPRRTT